LNIIDLAINLPRYWST